MYGPPWPDERADLLKKMWADGISAGHIGLALGLTRNAVIGKVFRMKLARHPMPHKRMKKPPLVPPAKSALPQRHSFEDQIAPDIRPVREPCLPATPRMIPLTALKENECRFPYDVPYVGGYRFCGHQIDPDQSQSYCPAHHHLTSNGRP